MSRTILTLLAVVALAACGNIEGKPLEPTPNGGPGTAPNNIFGNSNTNSVANNESPNVVVVNNGSPNNVPPNNSGNVGNVGTCGDDVSIAPAPLGFLEEPGSESGLVVDVSPNELVIDDGARDISFVVEGIDLTAYFGFEDSVSFQRVEFDNTRVDRVLGQNGFVEYVEQFREGSGTEPVIFFEGEFYGADLSTAIDDSFCTEASECGLRDRTDALHSVLFFGLGDDIEVDPFTVVSVGDGAGEVYVSQADTRVLGDVSNEQCAESGFWSGNLRFVVGSLAR